MAATAVVARRIGKNPDAAATAGVQTIWLSLGITALVSITGFVFAPDILRAMGAEENTVAVGTSYTRIMMGGSMVIMLLFSDQRNFPWCGRRVNGNEKFVAGPVCNIVLCPVLINGLGPIPAFGPNGAAMATNNRSWRRCGVSIVSPVQSTRRLKFIRIMWSLI